MTDFERKLAGFSPAAVDRDALLFAAGRASAPSPRWWQWACGLLIVTQAITLGLWAGWQRGSPLSTQPAAPALAAPAELPPAASPDPSSYLALVHTLDQPPTQPVRTAVADDPPLTAGSRSF